MANKVNKALKLQRGRALSSAESRYLLAGNEAEERLQRGRALSSAERGAGHVWALAVRVASTGPRSFERGEQVAQRPLDGGKHASTGPRSFERGELLLRIIDRVDDRASTGPRSFERGERARRDK